MPKSINVEKKNIEDTSTNKKKPQVIKSSTDSERKPIWGILFPRLYAIVQRIRSRRTIFNRNVSKSKTKITDIRRTEKGYTIVEHQT